MAETIRTYLLTLLVYLVLDAVWLGAVAPGFYKAQIGFLLAEEPDWLAAGLFYLLFMAGLVMLVVSPCLRRRKPTAAAWRGAMFGLVTYATYDLTNQATVAGWPWLVTLVDLAWGTALNAAVAYLSVRLGLRWFSR
jgi:uncharacterized membrane protein